MNKFLNLIEKFNYLIFLALAVITPLIFTTQTTELYEVPKMYFVYLATALLTITTLLRFALTRQIKIPTSMIVNSFAIFIIFQAVSTITSTDKFTSIYGYPTRLNGGLLSQFAYFVIFITALLNLTSEKAKKITVTAIFSAVAVSLWGIPSYFGRDPSCLVLTGKLTSACWQKEFDPTLRIFSTLGQPNWLASYLVLILPIALYKTISSKSREVKNIFLSSSIIIFLALVLTNSRAGAIGAIVAIVLLIILVGRKTLMENHVLVASLAIVFVLTTIIFGTKLTSRIKEGINSQQLKAATSQAPTTPTQTSLTSGGTESGQIRLIVWRGAINIFRRWPLTGSGPETFVNSYYLYRPLAHNQTTEWEFYYNKAHNEFLNYLANTGALGFLSYIIFLSMVSIFLFNQADRQNRAVLAAITGYQITIFFGFSTVATSLISTMFIALAILTSNQNQQKTYALNFLKNKATLYMSLILIALFGFYILTFVSRLYFTETLTKRAQSSGSLSGLLAYRNAITTSPVKNPYILSDFAYSISAVLDQLQNDDDKQKLIYQANESAQAAIKISPNNYLITQKLAKTYIALANENPKYNNQAISQAKKLTALAPTYPNAFITYAKAQIETGDKIGAHSTLENALKLKSNLPEAQELIDQLTKSD